MPQAVLKIQLYRPGRIYCLFRGWLKLDGWTDRSGSDRPDLLSLSGLAETGWTDRQIRIGQAGFIVSFRAG